MTDFYTFQPVTMHRSIAINLTKRQMGKVVTICENTSHRIRSKFGLWNVPGWVNAIINELYLTAHVTSLPDVPLPIFDEFADSNSRLAATLKYEWGTARIELELLLGDSQGNWASLGETAIKNSSGYRYRRHRLLDLLTDNPGFQLEENFKLGVMLKNMGFGDITDKDNLSITGNWLQEFVAVQRQPPYVVNNVYGNGGSVAPPPIPVLTITVSSSSTFYPVSGTLINISLSNGTKSTEYTANWKKGDTDTTVTTTVTTDSNGSCNTTFDSTLLASFGAGNYKLEIENSIPITSNELTAIFPILTVTPTAYNTGFSTIVVSVFGMEVGSTYTLGFVGVGTTSSTKTQTAETTDFNFSGGDLPTPGTYKARLTKGNLTYDSNDIVISAFPVVTLVPSLALFSNNTQITASVSNLQPSTALTYRWLKNGFQVSTTNSTSDANGNWNLSIGAASLQNSPFGEGSYRLEVVQDLIDIISAVIEVRSSIFYFQPVQNELFYPYQQLAFDLLNIPVGASFTYQLFKSGIALGTPTNQIFAIVSSGYPYHRISINTTDIYNSYGYSDFYSLKIQYNGNTFTSNTFKINQEPAGSYG